MVDDNILIEASYVEMSGKRVKVLNCLQDDDVKIPRDIAKETNVLPNHISKVLRELKDKNLLECINEEARKGRLYRLTPLGKEVREYIANKRG